VYHGAGLDELLARQDISAVVIALPIASQLDVVVKSLKAGKHVLSEKPVGPDRAHSLAVVEQYEQEYKSKGLVSPRRRTAMSSGLSRH